MTDNNGFSFLLMGDKNFFDIIFINVKNIRRHYPNAQITLYDWGFTSDQITEVQNLENLKLIKRDLKFVDIKINLHAYTFKETLLMIYKKFFNFFSFNNTVQYVKKEMLLINKVFCYKHYIENFGGKFVFLDGDAILVKKLDFSDYKEFDIGVTLRRLNEIINLKGNCQVLNSGVIFFFGTDHQNKFFIDSWIKEIDTTDEYLIEQTSMTRMLERIDPDFYNSYNYIVTLEAGNIQVKVVTLPCAEFNYNRIDEKFVYKNHIAILHFKGGRHNKENFENLLHTIELPIL